MFTSQYSVQNEPKMIKTYQGVDLSSSRCQKLQMKPLYKKYSKNDIHYVVDAIQKGLKPHTENGLKRINRKNAKKIAPIKLKKKTEVIADAKSLKPQSPESICMKALRTEFLSKFKDHKQQSKPIVKSQKIISKKLHQRKRRNQLIRLVKKYKQHLIPEFELRLKGYGRCPKVSRKQIIDFLLKKGIVANIEPNVTEQSLEQQSLEMSELNKKVVNSLKINLTPVVSQEDFPSLLK